MTESAPENPELEGIVSVGDRIADRYVVERVIGAGGMGVVVAARHEALGKPVAVKFLLPKVAQLHEPRERFLREAKAALEIRSEHVAHVSDVGTLESGAPYMVMEYLEGRDLSDTVEADGPLSVDEALELVLQACEAIGEAHARGLVHRDIKPANLFVTHRADGSPLVKLLDFGISRAAVGAEDEQRLTATHAVLGTPTYMAPEQLRGARNADARTDIWAIGATLHELLCGAPPFTGETVTALAVAIVEQQPTPLRQLVADVPAGVENAVLTCLEKDPAQRFQSIAAFVAAIEPYAPASAQVAIDLIMSVEEHGLSDAKLPPEARRARGSRRGRRATAQDDTLPGYDPGDTSPELARTSAAATGAEAGDTVGSWQAESARRGNLAGPLVAILALVGLGAVITWFALPENERDESTGSPPTAASATRASTTSAGPDPERSAAPVASATATASPTASASAVTSAPPATSTPPPPATGRPPATAGTGKIPAPSSEAPVDPIGDRK